MSAGNEGAAAIPETLEGLFGFSVRCSCGRTHSVELRTAALRSGALDEVVPVAREVGRRLSVVVVADRITQAIAGERVQRLLQKDGQRVAVCLVPDGAGGRPHAEERSLAFVEQALSGADLAVAVGAGTINDLAKLSSFRRGIPYLTLPTAPSMNGYTSGIAAVMLQGIKRTVDCHQPLAVIADLDILRKAPRQLIAAGLGDLESKPTATADFRLGGRLRGDYYCAGPEKVVLAAEARVADSAEALGRGDPAAVALLSEALLLSGISMKLAGSSSPASGGEHLISHYWDMTADNEGRVEGWHGAQVGVATLVTAALYEELAALPAEEIDVEALVAALPSRERQEKGIRARHGARANEVVTEFFKKLLAPEALRRELAGIRGHWAEIWRSLSEVLRPAGRIRGILGAGGAPTTAAEIGLTDRHLRESFLAAREIRGRFTVLDFAADLGVLESLSAAVLKRSGCLSH